ILVSTLSTHNQIPKLHKPPKRKVPLHQLVREIGDTLWNRSLISLTVAGLFSSVALGLNNGLGVYFGVYFWELKSREISFLAICTGIAAILAVLIAPRIQRTIGKKGGAVLMFLLALVFNNANPALRLLDVLPPNGTVELLCILICQWILGGAAG